MNRYERNTNLVIINASNRAQGIMPYYFMEDGTLLGLTHKGRKVFHKPITVYWMTAEQAYNVTRVQLNVQEIIMHQRRVIDLEMQQLKAVAYTLIHKQSIQTT